jgi:hypothetical protein
MRFDIVRPAVPSAETPPGAPHVHQIPQIVNDPHAILLMWNVIYLLVALALFAWQTAKLGVQYSRRNHPLIRHAIAALEPQ